MVEERTLEPGEVHQLYLTPHQYKLLKSTIDGLPDVGYKKLKEVIDKATTKHRPHGEMTRKERVLWVHDELREAEGEVITLQEEMESWAEKQKGTTFTHTAQHTEVQENVTLLQGVVQRLKGAREDLRALRFSGWNQPKKSSRWDKTHGPDSPFAQAVRKDREEKSP